MNALQILVLSLVSTGWGLFSTYYWTRGSRKQEQDIQDYLVTAARLRKMTQDSLRHAETDRLWAESQAYMASLASLREDLATTGRLQVIGTLMPPTPVPPGRPGYTIVRK